MGRKVAKRTSAIHCLLFSPPKYRHKATAEIASRTRETASHAYCAVWNENTPNKATKGKLQGGYSKLIGWVKGQPMERSMAKIAGTEYGLAPVRKRRPEAQ